MTILGKAALALGVWGWMMGASVAEEPTANVHFSVIREYNGKPVRNASVVLHPVTKKGQQARSGLQLKTDAEGNTNFDGVPYGPLRIQVLVPGFQTYGEDFEISKPDTQITIKLKRPQEQYSVYESHPQKGSDKAPPDAKADTKPNGQNESRTEAMNEGKTDAKGDPPKEDKPKP